MTPLAATVECMGCHVRANAVIAMASTALGGWVIEHIENRERAKSATIVVCPACRPFLADALSRAREGV